MSKVRVNIKSFTENIVHSSGLVHLLAKFWDEMNELFDLVNCDVSLIFGLIK